MHTVLVTLTYQLKHDKQRSYFSFSNFWVKSLRISLQTSLKIYNKNYCEISLIHFRFIHVNIVPFNGLHKSRATRTQNKPTTTTKNRCIKQKSGCRVYICFYTKSVRTFQRLNLGIFCTFLTTRKMPLFLFSCSLYSSYLDCLAPLLFMLHVIRTIDTITIATKFTIGKTVTVPVSNTSSDYNNLYNHYSIYSFLGKRFTFWNYTIIRFAENVPRNFKYMFHLSPIPKAAEFVVKKKP